MGNDNKIEPFWFEGDSTHLLVEDIYMVELNAAEYSYSSNK